jgi:large subunit ribosomal protein L22
MVKARLKHLRMSPRKVRLAADLVKGMPAKNAIRQLQFSKKRAAEPVLKVLNSAIANGESNFQLSGDNLYVAEVRVDEGPTLKRFIPRAMGRATSIFKRTSHITLRLEEKKQTKKVLNTKNQEKESKKRH